jgi:hypothetical protein
VDKRSFSLCVGNEGIKEIKRICLETRKWTMQFLFKKCVDVNGGLEYIKIINCVNKIHVRNLERCLG